MVLIVAVRDLKIDVPKEVVRQALANAMRSDLSKLKLEPSEGHRKWMRMVAK